MPTIDPSKLGAWFDEFGPKLLLYARQCFGSGGADDLVQEVFLRLMDHGREPDDVRAWLFAAARNAAISQGRSERRRGDREMRVAETRPAWFESRVDDRIDGGMAQAALSRLDPGRREIVVLRIWGGLTLQEIAGLVGMPVSTVHDQYRSALRSVRAEMESSCRKKN